MKSRLSKTAASFPGWMIDYGLQRSFFEKEPCPHCGDLRRRKYVLHPFPLPKPHPRGEWLLSDCSCVKKEVSYKRSRLNQMQAVIKDNPLAPRLRGHSFSNFKVTPYNEEPYKACSDFVRNFAQVKRGQGILLYGSPGTGKTHLAAAVVNSLAAEHSVAFVYVPSFLQKARRTRIVLEKYLAFDLLVFDDIGNGAESDWDIEHLLTIYDGRLNTFKPTIFTSNFDLRALEKRVGARLASRIRGNNLAVRMLGPDWRGL
ncbi:MAG TPA: ATP-binding protein [Firmicutes bacterium]|nr:ATP-binding protein [Bacillota bacterium]